MKKLIKTYPVQKITLGMITQESDVFRSSFHNYFPDRYALAAAYFDFAIDQYVNEENFTFTSSIANFLHLVKNNAAYFQKLNRQEAPDNFFETFCRSCIERSTRQTVQNKGEDLSHKEQRMIQYMVGGCAFLIR